jgi:hypothetical protein
MRPLAPRVFTLCAAMSLLLFAATAGLWVHSGFREVWCGQLGGRDPADGSARSWMVASNRGRIFLNWARDRSRTNPGPGRYLSGTRPAETSSWPWLVGSTPNGFGVAGFYHAHVVSPPNPVDIRLLAIPHWFVMAACLPLPARWYFKRSPARPGVCPTCGYDLRASPERCTECGTVASSAC